MTIDQVKQSFYNIRGVEFVEFDVKDRLLSLSVGVDGGRFEAICENQEHLDEVIDVVDAHQNRAVCNKKRSVRVKFVPNN